MKVKSIFENVLPSSSYTRRAGRSGRRENNEFHRLASTDTPDVNYHRNAGSTNSASNSQNAREKLIPANQLSIELDNLQHSSVRNIDPNRSDSHNPPSRFASDNESHRETELFVSSSQFDDAFRVYNPTSEELPQDESEDVLPFNLSDVRLKFREIISGENDIVEDVVSRIYSQREGDGEQSSNKICSSCQCGVRMAKSYTILVIIILIALLSAVSITVFLFSGESKSISTKNLNDLGVLSSHEWPLYDIESKRLNISFDTVKTEHKIWDMLVEDDNSEEKKTASSSDLALQSKVRQQHYPGLFSVNGHLIDEGIAVEVVEYSAAILKDNLNENSTKVEILIWKGEAINFAIQEMKRRLNISRNDDSLNGLFDDHLCDNEINMSCNITSGFRTINGSCNNVIHKTWGAQYSPFRRIIKPDIIKEKLPLSNSNLEQLTGGSCAVDSEASAILPLWGMFILHDTVKTAESPVRCEEIDVRSPQANFANKGMKFKKEICSTTVAHDNSSSNLQTSEKIQCFLPSSCPAVYPACEIGPPTSFNLITSFIDASNIYGSSEERANKLRTKTMGKMKEKLMKQSHGKGFLPIALEHNETCLGGSGDNCFLSGDDDVNQLSALTALNTVFVRHHNWVASWLHRLNPHWDDEKLFQESRRIVIAQIQHITYNEFLPQMLGSEQMNVSGLMPEATGFYELYDPLVDPSVSDAFAGAVGNFWYSMAVDKLQLIWKRGKFVRKWKLDIGTQILTTPESLIGKVGKGHIEAILRGFATLAVNRVGLEFSPQLRSLFIKPLNMTLDVVKMVLEKGRHLKLAPYIVWRKTCGFSEIENFQDLKQHWYPEAYASITKVYSNVEQVDLFMGMLAENPIPSGRVGPTLACLLIDQFTRFKKGDRFWYEGTIYSHHFTELQLKTIRETSLARILCDNTDFSFDLIQLHPMLLTSPQTNPLVSCSDSEKIPNLEFNLWKESPLNKYNAYKNDGNDPSDNNEWNFDSLEMSESDEESSSKNTPSISENQRETSTESVTKPISTTPHPFIIPMTTTKPGNTTPKSAHHSNATSGKPFRSTLKDSVNNPHLLHSNIYI